MIDPERNTKDAMQIAREKDVRRRKRRKQIERDRISRLHPSDRAQERDDREDRASTRSRDRSGGRDTDNR
jgi:hypothetical protein